MDEGSQRNCSMRRCKTASNQNSSIWRRIDRDVDLVRVAIIHHFRLQKREKHEGCNIGRNSTHHSWHRRICDGRRQLYPRKERCRSRPGTAFTQTERHAANFADPEHAGSGGRHRLIGCWIAQVIELRVSLIRGPRCFTRDGDGPFHYG